ncbi:MAG: hypothetical protein IT442_01800 [Phycisphaeraceae bacterium]|nr:hypothetical protein [Phycisphaeraceae bacterium]
MVLSLSGSVLEMTNSPNSHAMSLVLSVTGMNGLTRARVEALERLSAETTPVRMAEARHELAREAVAAGRRVFVITSDESGLSVRRAFPPGGFVVEQRAVVEDPGPTTGWRLQGEGWREHVGRRTRWHLYEVAPSARSTPASRPGDG